MNSQKQTNKMTLTPSLHHVQQFPGLPFYFRWFAFSIIQFIKLKKRPNFTQLTSHNMPSGCGRKGIRAPQKRQNQLPHVLIACLVPVP